VRRLCERPGCSLPTAVSYVIDNGGLVVRLDSAPSADPALAGSLCQKHADGLRVPRGWTIDDRREAVPRLFLAPDTNVNAAVVEKRSTKSSPSSQSSTANDGRNTDESGLFDTVSRAESSPALATAETETVPVEDTAAPSPITAGDERGAPWMPRLVRRTEDEEVSDVDADGAPVRGRLLGRAFGDRNRGV
jgi:hypothetical protein